MLNHLIHDMVDNVTISIPVFEELNGDPNKVISILGESKWNGTNLIPSPQGRNIIDSNINRGLDFLR